MNKVLLVLSIGVFSFYPVDTSGNTQINQVEDTPRNKPPKFLWDPDKRMWIESDDEDFDRKDYNGDDSDNVYNDLSSSGSGDNQTDPIEEEGIDEELFNTSSSNNNADSAQDIKSANNVTLASPPLTVEDGKTSEDGFVKYEEKNSGSVENPLNQALDPATVKDKTVESQVVEVNPATEYPLWPLDFDSKRTRPLQEEIVRTSDGTKPNVDKSVVLGTTNLKVVPLEDDESPGNNINNVRKSNNTKDSPITNIQLVNKEQVINLPIKPSEPSQNRTLSDKIYNIGAGPPEYHDSKELINKSHIKATLKPNKGPDTNIRDTNVTKNEVQSTTAEPRTEPTPEIVLPEIPLIDSNKSGEESVEKGTPTSSNITNRPTNTSTEGNITSPAPSDNANSIGIPSRVPEFSTSTQPTSTKINDTNSPGISTAIGLVSCLPTTTTITQTTLHWPETPANVTVLPEEVCLKEDGTPVTRKCLNGVWLGVNGTCSNYELPPRTHMLLELLNMKTTNPFIVTKNLTQITSDSTNVTSYQIHLVSKLLERVAHSPEVTEADEIDQVVKAVNNIMHYEPTKLKFSQSTLNCTDKILSSLDDCLGRANLGEIGYRSIVTEKLLVQEVHLQKTEFSGFKLASSEDVTGFQKGDVSILNQNMEFVNTSIRNLEIALLIPEDLKKAIKECRGSQATPNIISTVFYDDTLFNSNNDTQGRSEGKIISVLIPGFNCSFTEPLQIIFRPPNNSVLETKCAYWQYGSNEQAETIKGQWIAESKSKQFLNTTYQLCEFRHVTHFSLLVLGDLAIEISETDKKALDIITAVGSALSLLGLLAVLLTALAFKSYRSANAVVIHFSIAMAAQIVLLFMADHAGGDKLTCTIFGAALHYIVLSQFCWMLTIALLQYKRYVLVFSNPTKYLMTKACAFAWGLPLIPVIVVISIATDNYGRNSYGLCYAVGNYFIFGVLIPVAIIVFINLLVFLRIMIYIASRKIKAHRKMDNATSLQLRLAIMLYFLLGLTWGFGLISAIGGGVVYAYLFCITATLQGFVLFLFFIALSDKTRSLWGSTLLCPCLDKKKKYDVSTDSSSHPMVRRPTSTNTSDTFTEGTGNEVFQKYKNRSSKDF